MSSFASSSLPARALFRLRHHWGDSLVRYLRTCRWRWYGARIGEKTLLPKVTMTWPHQVQLGAHCTLEPDILFKFDGVWKPGPSIIIGDHAFLGRGCEFNIQQRITIGADTLIASGAKFIDHDHGIVQGQLMRTQTCLEKPIEIGRDCWIGVNAVVLKGVVMGEGAILGAGAVLTKSVPPGEIWGGVPARKIGSRK